MNSKARLLPIIAVLAALLAIVPVAAATGTVDLSKDLITAPGGTLTVTVDDPDLDSGVAVANEATDFAGLHYLNSGGATSTTFFRRVQLFPLLDNNADGILNFLDVAVSTTDVDVLTISPSGGLVTFRVLTQGTGGFTVSYTAAAVQEDAVTISSTQDPVGFRLAVRETGASTGEFEADFVTATTTATNHATALSVGTVVRGLIAEDDVAVDFNLNETTTGDNITISSTLAVLVATTTAPNNFITEGALWNLTSDCFDLDGNGRTTDRIFATSTIRESTAGIDFGCDGAIATTTGDVIGLDLNGDGDTADAGTGLDGFAILNLAQTASEQRVRVDLDGDGTFEAISEAGNDLNNDGDATDSIVTGINVAGLSLSPTRPTIQAITGSVITAIYADADPAGTRTAGSTVETTDPEVTLLSPEDGTSTVNIASVLSAEVTDGDSGVEAGDIVFNILSATNLAAADVSGDVNLTAPITTALATSDGFRAQSQLQITSGVQANDEITITWNVVGTDDAGNVGTSDDQILVIDLVRPDLIPETRGAAVTGEWLDDDALNSDPEDAVNTSIGLHFTEGLDNNTVAASDFTVDGVSPAGIMWHEDVPDVVFLTVSTLAADDKPDIEVVGDISDAAGNVASVGQIGDVTALDGISPTVSVDVSPTLDADEVTIDVSTDEPMLIPPTITANGSAVGLTPQRVSDSLYRFAFEPGDTPNAYNLEVAVLDRSQNPASTGEADPTGDDAILFEVDDQILDPLTDPADDGTVFRANPFITLDFTNEGNEYGLDVNGNPTTTAANIDEDLDTHAGITITAITLDDVDVSAQMDTDDDRTFIVSTRDLSLGDHDLVLTAEDEAGNELEDFAITFEVDERPAFEIPLRPGWNLISMPGEPVDPDINSVIDPALPIDVVMTYDPRVAGGWLVATRGDDGLLGGTLTSMTANRGYWVSTASFESIETVITPVQGGIAAVLPTARLARGWNLMPVLDVSGTAGAGDPLPTSPTFEEYLGGLDVARIYEYNTIADRFDRKELLALPEVGVGYWVYLTTAGDLVP